MIVLCYGLPKMGKTTWIHDYIRAHPQHRFFIVDRSAEWGPEAGHWRGQPPNPIEVFEASDTLPEHGDFPDAGVFVFRGREPFEIGRLTLAVGNATYVDDEIDFSAGKKGWEDSPFRIIVHQGRHAPNARGEFTQVNIVGACRRPQSLHTDLSEIADEVNIFQVRGSRTLERLKNDNHIEDDEWDTIRTLPQWHFKHWPSGNYFQVEPLQGAAEPPPYDPREDDGSQDDT